MTIQLQRQIRGAEKIIICMNPIANETSIDQNLISLACGHKAAPDKLAIKIGF